MKNGSVFGINCGTTKPDFRTDYKSGDSWDTEMLFNWNEFRVAENNEKFIKEDERTDGQFVLHEKFQIFIVYSFGAD